MAAKNKISVLKTPGTIDADYRGEIKVILINLGEEIFTVEKGSRIAQMVLCPIAKAKLKKLKIWKKQKEARVALVLQGINNNEYKFKRFQTI